MRTVLTHPDAAVNIDEQNGQRSISVELKNGLVARVTDWVTSYPLELIEHVLRVKGPAYLCDEIMRDESPQYVRHDFQWDILSYAGEEGFAGRRILDFGSGSGSSSMVLARMFPEARIVGVELVPEFTALAQHRARFYGVEDRVTFHVSPDPESLPQDIGHFDYVVLSAVYEHLLPGERPALLALLWRHLKPGGILFLNQTPNRWSPQEMHTTGLPFLNYLPDRMALHGARRLSKRVRHDATWPELLRAGIRGGTTRQIMSSLGGEGRTAELLEPSRLGVENRIDLWYRLSSPLRQAQLKRIMSWGFKAVNAITGLTIVPGLSLAIRKVH